MQRATVGCEILLYDYHGRQRRYGKLVRAMGWECLQRFLWRYGRRGGKPDNRNQHHDWQHPASECHDGRAERGKFRDRPDSKGCGLLVVGVRSVANSDVVNLRSGWWRKLAHFMRNTHLDRLFTR